MAVLDDGKAAAGQLKCQESRGMYVYMVILQHMRFHRRAAAWAEDEMKAMILSAPADLSAVNHALFR